MPRNPASPARPGPARLCRSRERSNVANAGRACAAARGLLRLARGVDFLSDRIIQPANRAERPGIGPAGALPLGLAFGERWFAVNTQPLAEARATRNLENQGFRTFMLRRRKMLRHARRMTMIEAPLFPRYLFVVFDPQ